MVEIWNVKNGRILKKANDKPKLTKDELGEWLTMTVRRRAKSQIRYPDRDKKSDLTSVSNYVYEGLVEDWIYNKNILEACRALKVSQGSIASMISDLFDDDGKPIPLKAEDGIEVAKQSEPAYYSMSTIREEYEYLKKMQAPDEQIGSKSKDSAPKAKGVASKQAKPKKPERNRNN